MRMKVVMPPSACWSRPLQLVRVEAGFLVDRAHQVLADLAFHLAMDFATCLLPRDSLRRLQHYDLRPVTRWTVPAAFFHSVFPAAYSLAPSVVESARSARAEPINSSVRRYDADV